MTPAKPGPACPVCGKDPSPNYRPFCSRRCADVDLHRWMAGRYVIPIADPDEPDSAPVPDNPLA